MKIAIIGRGNIGGNLAKLAVASGHDVTVGLRKPEGTDLPYPTASIEDAIGPADMVILAVPYPALAALVPQIASALAGKVVIDPTNPLNDDYSPMILGAENSAAEQIAEMAPEARVVKGFNAIFAANLTPEAIAARSRPAAVFLASDDVDAMSSVADFVRGLGLAPVTRSTLTGARQLEAMCHLMIGLGFGDGYGTGPAFEYGTA